MPLISNYHLKNFSSLTNYTQQPKINYLLLCACMLLITHLKSNESSVQTLVKLVQANIISEVG